MQSKILIVDDDAPIVELLEYNLKKAGYATSSAFDGEDALLKTKQSKYDLIILDIMLPKIDGFEVARRIRADNNATPILFLSARREEVDRIQGFELGADDYVSKPFSPRELISRIRAVLRRSLAQNPVLKDQVLKVGDLQIDQSKFEVSVRGRQVDLTAKEFELLKFLVENAGLVFNRDDILMKLWDYDYAGDARTVDVHIRHLREKIEINPSRPEYIQTVRGVGYRFRAR